jgi:sec-independent protein translocase protein TatA
MLDLFSVPHMLIVLVVVMLLFGTKKLPEISAGLGRAIKNFRQAVNEPDEVDITAQKEEPGKPKE